MSKSPVNGDTDTDAAAGATLTWNRRVENCAGHETIAALDVFEHSTDRAFHIGLARNCLAAVPDAYTEDQLDDIGRRARHWVLKAAREHMLKDQTP